MQPFCNQIHVQIVNLTVTEDFSLLTLCVSNSKSKLLAVKNLDNTIQ